MFATIFMDPILLEHLVLTRQVRSAFTTITDKKHSVLKLVDRTITKLAPRTDDGLSFLELANDYLETARHCRFPQETQEHLIEALEATYWMNEAEAYAENFDMVWDEIFSQRI